MRFTMLRFASALTLLLAGGSIAGCSLTIEAVTGEGIGARCSTDVDCHAGVCDLGLCTASCARDSDCPAPSACFAGSCALPLQVSALWEEVVSGGEGWDYAFHDGMKEAAAALSYVGWDYQQGVTADTPTAIGYAVDQHVKAGAQVIVGDSQSQQADLLAAAARHPGVKFLIGGGTAVNGENLVSFDAPLEQALYVAGKLAAMKAKKRLGYIADLPSPAEVRQVNAFTLGARTVNPDIVVEVAWIGYWLDYSTAPGFDYKGETLFREEQLAARLIDTGCEVIAHDSDSERAVRYIDAKVSSGAVSGVWSIADNNDDACRALGPSGPSGPLMASCLGAAYYNRGVPLTALLDTIHRGTFDASSVVRFPMTGEPATSPVGFALNPASGIDEDAAQRISVTVARDGPQAVFKGPYAITGQRDKNGDGEPDAVQAMAPGEVIGDAEYARVCWFVKGVVEKANPKDPSSADVDALVPDVGVPPPPDLFGPAGTSFQCHDNL